MRMRRCYGATDRARDTATTAFGRFATTAETLPILGPGAWCAWLTAMHSLPASPGDANHSGDALPSATAADAAFFEACWKISEALGAFAGAAGRKAEFPTSMKWSHRRSVIPNSFHSAFVNVLCRSNAAASFAFVSLLPSGKHGPRLSHFNPEASHDFGANAAGECAVFAHECVFRPLLPPLPPACRATGPLMALTGKTFPVSFSLRTATGLPACCFLSQGPGEDSALPTLLPVAATLPWPSFGTADGGSRDLPLSRRASGEASEASPDSTKGPSPRHKSSRQHPPSPWPTVLHACFSSPCLFTTLL